MREYNPEGSALRQCQKEMLEILVRFDQICKEHDIKWWLCSGTLLGAARHGGFIPWDDDIDVSMMRSEYYRLKKILINLNDDELVFQCTETDPDYIYPFGRLRKREGDVGCTKLRSRFYKYKGPFIDIFCIEKSNRFASRSARFFYREVLLPTEKMENKFWRHLTIRTVQFMNRILFNPLCRIVGRTFNPKKQYRYEMGSGFYNQCFYKKHIFPLSTIEFEGHVFPAPGDVEGYLTNMYGDWRQLPSEAKIRRSLHSPIYIKEIFGE